VPKTRDGEMPSAADTGDDAAAVLWPRITPRSPAVGSEDGPSARRFLTRATSASALTLRFMSSSVGSRTWTAVEADRRTKTMSDDLVLPIGVGTRPTGRSMSSSPW
jgi:hypothetical protein